MIINAKLFDVYVENCMCEIVWVNIFLEEVLRWQFLKTYLFQV